MDEQDIHGEVIEQNSPETSVTEQQQADVPREITVVEEKRSKKPKKTAKKTPQPCPDEQDKANEPSPASEITVVEEQPSKKSKKGIIAFVAIAVCAILVLGGLLTYFLVKDKNAIAATVTIDVNPTVQLSISGSKTVLSAAMLNAESSELLAGLSLNGKPAEEALAAILAAMREKGYLGNASDAILISVIGEDAALMSSLLQSLKAEALKQPFDNIAVMTQSFAETDKLLADAQQYGVSTGKARLFELLKLTPTSNIPLCEAALFLNNSKPTGVSVDIKGDPFKSLYDEALRIAKDNAPISPLNVINWTISLSGSDYVFELLLDSGDAFTSTVNGASDAMESWEEIDAETSSLVIGNERAAGIALEAAGVSKSDLDGEPNIRFYPAGYNQHGVHYQVWFDYDETEYYCAIDAVSGEILEQTETPIVPLPATSTMTIEQAIREQLGKPEGELTQADLDSITELAFAIPEGVVVDLLDLPQLKNLEILFVDGPPFELSVINISALAAYEELTHLSLWGCGITDISPLAALTQLTYLDLSYNPPIESLAPLRALTNLERLEIYGVTLKASELYAFMTAVPACDVEFSWWGHTPDMGEGRALCDLIVEKAVRWEIEKPIGELTQEDLDSVTSLLLNVLIPPIVYDHLVPPVFYADYLARLTNLEELILWNSCITDFSPLYGLTKLRSLKIISEFEFFPLDEQQESALRAALPDCDIQIGEHLYDED